MKITLTTLALIPALLIGAQAFATQRTTTLNIPSMDCVGCTYIVKKSLASVAGVEKVTISAEQRTATVTFDDSKTNAASLAEVSGQAGFPAQPAQ